MKGEGRWPSSLPASFALVLALLFLCCTPHPSIFLSSISILSISFHFSCTGCTRINNYRPHFSPPPPFSFHHHLPISTFANPFCLSLEALSCFFSPLHPLLLPSLRRFEIENKVLKGQKDGEMKCEGKEEKGVERKKDKGGQSSQHLGW